MNLGMIVALLVRPYRYERSKKNLVMMRIHRGMLWLNGTLQDIYCNYLMI